MNGIAKRKNQSALLGAIKFILLLIINKNSWTTIMKLKIHHQNQKVDHIIKILRTRSRLSKKTNDQTMKTISHPKKIDQLQIDGKINLQNKTESIKRANSIIKKEENNIEIADYSNYQKFWILFMEKKPQRYKILLPFQEEIVQAKEQRIVDNILKIADTEIMQNRQQYLAECQKIEQIQIAIKQLESNIIHTNHSITALIKKIKNIPKKPQPEQPSKTSSSFKLRLTLSFKPNSEKRNLEFNLSTKMQSIVDLNNTIIKRREGMREIQKVCRNLNRIKQQLEGEVVYFLKKIMKERRHSKGIIWLGELLIKKYNASVGEDDLQDTLLKEQKMMIIQYFANVKQVHQKQQQKNQSKHKMKYVSFISNQKSKLNVNEVPTQSKTSRGPLSSDRLHLLTTKVYFDIQEKQHQNPKRHNTISFGDYQVKSFKKLYNDTGEAVSGWVKNRGWVNGSQKCLMMKDKQRDKRDERGENRKKKMQQEGLEEKIKTRFSSVKHFERRKRLNKIVFGTIE